MTNRIYLAVRNSAGQLRTYNPAELPADVSPDVRAAADAVLAAVTPKRGRGRPKGYRCSAETVAAMVGARMATLAARKQAAKVAAFDSNVEGV